MPQGANKVGVMDGMSQVQITLDERFVFFTYLDLRLLVENYL